MILDLSFRRVLPLVFLATVIALPLSTFIQSGLVLKDDWVPLNPNFSFYSLFWWNPANRLGSINQNIDWLPFNEFYAALATGFGIETGAKLFVYAIVLIYALAHYIAFSLYYRIVRMVQYSAMATVSALRPLSVNCWACLGKSFVCFGSSRLFIRIPKGPVGSNHRAWPSTWRPKINCRLSDDGSVDIDSLFYPHSWSHA